MPSFDELQYKELKKIVAELHQMARVSEKLTDTFVKYTELVEKDIERHTFKPIDPKALKPRFELQTVVVVFNEGNLWDGWRGVIVSMGPTVAKVRLENGTEVWLSGSQMIPLDEEPLGQEENGSVNVWRTDMLVKVTDPNSAQFEHHGVIKNARNFNTVKPFELLVYLGPISGEQWFRPEQLTTEVDSMDVPPLVDSTDNRWRDAAISMEKAGINLKTAMRDLREKWAPHIDVAIPPLVDDAKIGPDKYIADDQGRMLPPEWRHNLGLGRPMSLAIPIEKGGVYDNGEHILMTREQFVEYNQNLLNQLVCNTDCEKEE